MYGFRLSVGGAQPREPAECQARRRVVAGLRQGGLGVPPYTAGGRFPGLPAGFEPEGTHCVVAPLAQGTTLRGAPRLALHPFWLERAPYTKPKSALGPAPRNDAR
jgi:hypothetical protein